MDPYVAASTSAMAFDPQQMVGSRGPGQDFVLFDEGQRSGATASMTPSTQSLQQFSNSDTMAPSMTMTSRPSFDHKSSFTEYRASLPASQIESPFSSPASRADDDFDNGLAAGNHIGSGTLTNGTPKSKRQRNHAYSSSWNGGNIQQYRRQNHQGASGGTLATAMAPTQSYGGYARGNASTSDWSGSDTSPQNPSSGSFGPPIHSLSLGDGSDGAVGMPSLFPATTATPASSMQEPSKGAMMIQSPMSNAQHPPSSLLAMTPQQQEARARQQIQAELVGVDSRALKGPLRDIQQGTAQGIGGSGPNDVLFFNQAFSSPYGSHNFFPSMQIDNSGQRPGGLMRQRSGSMDESFLSGGGQDDGQAGTMLATGWNGQPTNNLNAFDLQGLDSMRGQQHQPSSTSSRPALPGPQFSSRTQQAVDRARAQKPIRGRMTRDGSGLTVSPQEAFLDYNDIDSVIQASRAQSQSLPASAQNLFAPPPPGLTEMLGSESHARTPKAVSREDLYPFASSGAIHEGTPSLVEASSSSSNGSRGTSSIASPLQRMPLSREDTVRPLKAQAEVLTPQPFQNNDFLSPAFSTSSSTDDEDEKPYEPDKPAKIGWQFPFPSQPSNNAASGQQSTNSGPRFSVVSSSSSESEQEEELQRGRRAKDGGAVQQQGRRTMGGYGYMGSSEESGLSATTPYFAHPYPPSSQQLAPSSQHSSTSSSLTTSHPAGSGHNRTPQSAGGQSDSQSQDEGPILSPSIRSSAQAIAPPEKRHGAMAAPTSHATQTNARQRSRSRNRAHGAAAADASPSRRSLEAESSANEETSEWETGGESEADASEYQDRRANTSRTAKTASTTKKRRHDGSIHRVGGASEATSAYHSSSGSQLTICDYVSPLTDESCQTEFHRPYDLARHRETIHAREEALLLRQGRLKKDQCIVLFKEVDPEKSLATVEWKCEGKNGCGSLFSRKDALLRHKRIRGH